MELKDQAVKEAILKKLGGETADEQQLSSIQDIFIHGAETLADIPKLSGLRWLHLKKCNLKDPEILSGLTQVRELWLDKVTGVKSEHLTALTQLETLWVQDCGEWCLQPLSGLTNLQTLTLDNLGIRDISELAGMTELTHLSLRNNPVTDASVLLGMKKLQYLYIDPAYLKNRNVLLDEHLSEVLDEVFWPVYPGNKPYPTAETRTRPGKLPQVKYLANVHPRVHFCRDAALVWLSGGLERLVCRDYGKGRRKEDYDLYLDGVSLVETDIPGCGTCSTRLRAGYGDGLMNEEACLVVRDSLNAGYEGLKKAIDNVAPFIGLMKSGLYLVADFDLFPVQNYGSSFDYFWDAPDYSTELHFVHIYPGGGNEILDAPLFLAPSQRAANMDPAQVELYRKRLQEGEPFPRAVALYLNGGVALLLDGHHKAAACAAEGVPVKTLVIFPVEKTEQLEQACSGGKRLYLHHTKHMSRHSCGSGPLNLRDGQGKELSRVSCLKKMEKRSVYAFFPKEVPWGRVSDEFRTEKFRNYPNPGLLEAGTRLPPDQIRTLIRQEMGKARGTHDQDALSALQAYAKLFPESQWLSPSERAWLSRSWLEFEFEDVTVLPPDGAEDGK